MHYSKPLSLFLALLACATLAKASDLEDLFNQGHFDRFFEQAKPLSEHNEADALFLIGKAYHLGKGVEKDLIEAEDYYSKARARGSIRAAHNLGTMRLDAGDRDGAIVYLKEALAGGLKMPTFTNLARAYSPEDHLQFYDNPQWAEDAKTAGDFYAKAYGETPNDAIAFSASREYLRGYLYTEYLASRQSRTHESADSPSTPRDTLRKLALDWLTIGTNHDFGPSWANLGVLYRTEKKFAEARHAFEKAISAGNRDAHFFLAQMAEQGEGGAQPNKAEALIHYEAAAKLGYSNAREPAVRLIMRALDGVSDEAHLADAIQRIRALSGDELHHFSYDLDQLTGKLDWIRLFKANQRATHAIPKQLSLHACKLGMDEPDGFGFNIGYNTTWRLVGYQTPGEGVELGVKGLVTQAGCAVSKLPLPPMAYQILKNGGLLALHFPNHTLPLQITQTGQRAILELSADPVRIP